MSRDRIEFEVGATMQDTLDACRAAATKIGWKAKGEGPARLELKQGFTLTGNPVTLDVNLAPLSDRDTSVRVDGRTSGMGPIHKSKVQKALNTLQSEVVAAMPRHQKRDSTSESAATQVEALTSLQGLRDKGVLTDAEFEDMKRKLLNRD